MCKQNTPNTISCGDYHWRPSSSRPQYQQQQNIPQLLSNESSDLSIGSEKELEILMINSKATCNPPIVEKKGSRKRKRLEFKADTPRPETKSDRKITDYIRASTLVSPKRGHIIYSNGDSASGDAIQLTPLCVSPVQVVGHYVHTNNRSSLVYPSSDSNQSPPPQQTIRAEKAVQAGMDSPEQGELGKQMDDKKAKEVENLLRINGELKQSLELHKAKVRASKETIKRLMVEQSRMERKKAKERVMEATLRIGQFRPTRLGEHFKDQWIDGWAMEEINKQLQRINQERNEIVNATQNLKKCKAFKAPKRQTVAELPSTSSSNAGPTLDDGFVRPELPKEMTAQEYIEQEEIYRLRKEHLKREEIDLLAEKDRLERERNLHIREMKRVQCEEQSRFKDNELMHERYLLLSLLGKGGFSEVWRAFDLEENRYVACKIHHVNKEWKEDKKANYVKHAMREKDIHKSLDHPRIVRLFDLFTIDNDSFCTVLEYCDGNDLDFYLKQHKQIPEKEARCIIMQVVSALKYLSERKYPIIHYDLKPANILLQSGTTSGEIKITDFGLSKTMENAEDGDESIELTSQGAGTYWYLPPETFTPFGDGGPPKISNKVDVWSVGVIFYQCIYGRRPFGHEKTQQQILEERTIFNAQEVIFPTKPQVTASAQDFIRRCLQCRKEERADVSELIRHELFRPRGQKSQQPPSPSAKIGRIEQAECD
uniref:Protein kinase domain-containing protein n=1 Tax=Globodera rostochiensis TaxID=31243 RepID=A0A914HE53_GLORO